MKIFRFFYDAGREKYVNDLVLSVVKETRTQLVAIDRMHPRDKYRFHKPDKPQDGMPVFPVGKREKFSQFHYEIMLESGAI